MYCIVQCNGYIFVLHKTRRRIEVALKKFYITVTKLKVRRLKNRSQKKQIHRLVKKTINQCSENKKTIRRQTHENNQFQNRKQRP